VRDQFGSPVPNRRVSFQVTGGPHADNNLDNDANTPNGFFGQCTTDANGRCSASYTGSELGTDTIQAFLDANANFQFDGGEISDEVSKTWVALGQGTARVRLDMEGCNGDRTAPVDESTWDEQAQPNPAGGVHEICAERFNALDEPQAGPVTFTITSGPGFFTNAAGTANLGNTVTVDESGDGYVHAFIRSNQVGTTVVEAREGNATDTGRKPWVTAPANARNIDLQPEAATNPPATEHEVVAKVTDRFGNPVPGVTVTFTESGPGRFVTGGSSTTEVTDANGEARARTTTTPNEQGDQQITASIDPGATDCELPANQPDQGDPAGNCSDTVVKTWGEQQPTACPGFDGDPRNQIVGDEGDNFITGTDGDDIICALGGDDTIDGAGGNDLILAGPGNDTVDAGEGDDTVRGGSGNDLIRGGIGEDNLSGGSGDDQVRGGADADAIQGGQGKDNLLGGSGDDAISGNRGHDLILGGSGNDSLKGNRGNDTLSAQTGNDTLQGGSGNDILKGGSGNDTLRGYTGDDILNGGPGIDTCKPGRGRDRVTNCER
jgi:Ca2+-binding RTX toxin-like protein